MSEFKCKQGHLILPSQGIKCLICGGRIHSVDNISHESQENFEDKKLFEPGDFEERDPINWWRD